MPITGITMTSLKVISTPDSTPPSPAEDSLLPTESGISSQDMSSATPSSTSKLLLAILGSVLGAAVLIFITALAVMILRQHCVGTRAVIHPVPTSELPVLEAYDNNSMGRPLPCCPESQYMYPPAAATTAFPNAHIIHDAYGLLRSPALQPSLPRINSQVDDSLNGIYVQNNSFDPPRWTVSGYGGTGSPLAPALAL